MKMFQVGGCVRDEILGVQSKDIDFTVVLDDHDLRLRRPARVDEPYAPVPPFKIMTENLERMGFKIFLETPEFLTVRARFPRAFFGNWHARHYGQTADFVLARKESGYTDGRRPDHVEPGTLMDDLARRDFTMNAIAKDENGNLIDPFDGRGDIEKRLIRTVGNPRDRFSEDALRIVRAMRFSVTKGFSIEHDTRLAMHDMKEQIVNVSAERVREELAKMFNVSLSETLMLLDDFHMWFILEDLGINFMPTLKEKIK